MAWAKLPAWARTEPGLALNPTRRWHSSTRWASYIYPSYSTRNSSYPINYHHGIWSSTPSFSPSSSARDLKPQRYPAVSLPSFPSRSFCPDSKPGRDAFQGKMPEYYAMFPKTLHAGPPPSGPFSPDLRELRREFLQLQASTHPDLHRTHGQSKAKEAQERSALINEAYRVLKDPLARGLYLLAQHGIPSTQEEKVHQDQDKTTDFQSDPDLLDLVMMAQEEVAQAKTRQQISSLKVKNEARIRAATQDIEQAFACNELSAARAGLIKLRFWYGVRSSLDARFDEAPDGV